MANQNNSIKHLILKVFIHALKDFFQ
jgi:hypothetical protein